MNTQNGVSEYTFGFRQPTLINGSGRNIYYKDPELFRSQKVVDRYVDILSYTLGVQRAALNVVSALPAMGMFYFHADLRTTQVATAKGLIAGTFATTYNDGSTKSHSGYEDVLAPFAME